MTEPSINQQRSNVRRPVSPVVHDWPAGGTGTRRRNQWIKRTQQQTGQSILGRLGQWSSRTAISSRENVSTLLYRFQREKVKRGQLHSIGPTALSDSSLQADADRAGPDKSSGTEPAESPQPPDSEVDSPDGLPHKQRFSEDGNYDLPLDQIFEILKNSRRRQTLRYLEEHGGETTLSDLAEHIAALENDTTTRAITSAQRKRAYIGLYQCHLPKMDDVNVVDFDQNRGEIELGANADQLDPYLDRQPSRDWYKIYLGVALVGTALFVGWQLTGPMIDVVSTLILVGLVAGITLSAVAHSIAVRE